ncbi:MAG: isochorismatase family protein [Glaciecola sp.]
MLDRKSTGVIFVDIQGTLANIIEQTEPFIANTVMLYKGAKVLGLPTVVLEQMPHKLGATTGALSQCFDPLQTIISKHHFNACHEPAFIKELQNPAITDWLVCGIEAHICVYQTIVGMLETQRVKPQSVQVVLDAIGSRSGANKQLAINKLGASGVQFTSTEMCLYELTQDAQSDDFKEILAIIK